MNNLDKKDALEQIKYLSALIPTRGEMIAFMNFACRVNPLQRPRVAPQGHIYQPKENQKELLCEVMQEVSLIVPPVGLISSPIIVDHYIQFARPSQCKEVFVTNKKFGDYDNLAKAINDALVVSKIIKDDSLIVDGRTIKFYDFDYDSIDYCTVVIYLAVCKKDLT